MSDVENFRVLVDRAMQVQGRAYMRPVIEKELLHYDILFALEQEGLLDQLTFQGGTSLRLCYGSPRFSEDLDFVGGKNYMSAHLLDMKKCLEKYIGERYGFEVRVKEPKEMALEPDYQDIKIDKWQISIATTPKFKDVPRQKIKIEIGNIPAYTREPKSLEKNYDFLPDGYSDTLIMVESLDEIMADKLVSLVNCQRYVRHRDIWDLHWLKTKGALMNAEYVLSKIEDYKITDYPEKLETMLERLDGIIHGKSFRDEMLRFIPLNVQERTLKKDKFYVFLIAEIQGILLEVKGIVTA